MGDIWDSIVKSVECCLKVIIKDKLFINNIYLRSGIYYQSMTWYACERWCKVLQSHFIIGNECYNFSPSIYETQEINLHQKWPLVQAAAKLLWDTWKQEYLPMLNVCRKWSLQYPNFLVGKLVVISTKVLP